MLSIDGGIGNLDVAKQRGCFVPVVTLEQVGEINADAHIDLAFTVYLLFFETACIVAEMKLHMTPWGLFGPIKTIRVSEPAEI